MSSDAFTEFEHRGWERVAEKYDLIWASSTRQFIPALLDASGVGENMSLLDVGCGPGYVAAAAAERGAKAIGLDFSGAMVAIAREKFPEIDFREGNAQNLPFAEQTFDRVVANFALLHTANPERVFAEVHRILRRGGGFGFTTWAPKEENAFIRLVDEAIHAHADLDVDLPSGPPFYLFETEAEFRRALGRAGFQADSMKFNLHTIEWYVPSAGFVFEAERTAGVRTAGLLARQTPEALRAIKARIEDAVRAYAKGDSFAIPKSAYIIAVKKA